MKWKCSNSQKLRVNVRVLLNFKTSFTDDFFKEILKHIKNKELFSTLFDINS